MKDPLQHFISYLKERNIPYVEETIEATPRIIIVLAGYPACPGGKLEACIYFHKEAHAIEARVYFADPAPAAVKRSGHLSDLYRLLNRINAKLFPRNEDHAEGSVYTPSYLITPRFYVTEDGCFDLTAALVMDNDFFELAPLEIEDYLTIALPRLIADLSPFIFGVLRGDISAEYAIRLIESRVL